MILLELVFFLIIPFGILQVSTKNSDFFSTMVLFYLFLALVYVAGFRVSSPDYNNYVKYFELLAAGEDYHRINIVAADPAFAYLNYFLANFTKNSQVIFISISLMAVAINLASFRRYSPYFLLCVLFYVAHTYVAREMMQIRAGLACALCLYSVRYIIDKNVYPFLITVAFAALMHLGASVFILAYFIGTIKITRKSIALLILTALLIGVIYPLGALLKLLPSIGFLERVQYYNNSKYGEVAGVFTNIVIIKGFLLSAFCLYYYKILTLRSKYFQVFFKLYAFSLIWYLVWNDFEIFAARIATFYSIGEVILLSYIPLIVRTSKDRFICSLLLVTVALSIFYLNYSTGKWDDIILPWASS